MELQKDLPIVTLKDMVVYPHAVQPLFIGTTRSIRALEFAQKNDPDKQVLLVAKKHSEQEDPAQADLFGFGTVSTILQLIRLQDKTVKILVEGGYRAKIVKIADGPDFFTGDVLKIPEEVMGESQSEAIVRSIMTAFDQYVQLSKKVPPEVMASLSSIDEPNRLVDTICSQMTLKLQDLTTSISTSRGRTLSAIPAKYEPSLIPKMTPPMNHPPAMPTTLNIAVNRGTEIRVAMNRGAMRYP